MRKKFQLGMLSLFIILPARAATFYDLGTLPGYTHSSGYDVSDNGNTVVGLSLSSPLEQAFRWTPSGGMVGLGYLAGYSYSTANGVSGNGSVIVGSSRTTLGQSQAFRWTQAGGMIGLGGNGSVANAVSGDGNVITGQYVAGGTRAFRWTPASGMQNLGTFGGYSNSIGLGVSSDGTTIVGLGSTSGSGQAFRWTQAGGMVGLGWLPGDTNSQAIAASADGSVVVGNSGASLTPDQSGFRWTQSQGMVDLGLYSAYGVSGDGSVVVGSLRVTGAAIWDEAHGVRDLKSLLIQDGINLNGWSLANALDVSADGKVITGVGQFGSQLRGWMVVIPEPAAGTLVLLGGAAFLRRNISKPVSPRKR